MLNAVLSVVGLVVASVSFFALTFPEVYASCTHPTWLFDKFQEGHWYRYSQSLPDHFDKVFHFPGVCEKRQSSCGLGEVNFNGSCYELTSSEFNEYGDAAASCREMGAELVAITSAAENAVVADLCSTRPGDRSENINNLCWIG